MSNLKVIHPFPARMAPEIAHEVIARLPEGSKLLDPMCGSGTVLRSASETGVESIGVDIDPLAVLMSRVWTQPPDVAGLLNDAKTVVSSARDVGVDSERPSWQDAETVDFIDYWFAAPQQAALLALVQQLWSSPFGTKDALMLALSRTIVTKERGASLARDVSHSRPHKVAETNSYDVFDGFLKSVTALASRLHPERVRATSTVKLGDSRSIDWIESDSVDCVVTSPPYLNALDYLRGHRLALVWLGYPLHELRSIRGASVGAERILGDSSIDIANYISSDSDSTLPARYMGWIRRYAEDSTQLVAEIARVVRPGGKAVLVVGNSFLRGCRVDNAQIFGDLLTSAGADIQTFEREIPAQRRYLPLPEKTSPLSARMRTEVVLQASF